MLRALLLLAGACGAVAQQASVLRRQGLSVSVLCLPGPPLERCRVERASPGAHGARTTWRLKEKAPASEEGRDQCGFSVESQAAAGPRPFRCLLRLQQREGAELVDVFKIVVQKSPDASTVYVSSTGHLSNYGVNDRFPSNEEFVFRENDTVTATCAFPELRRPHDLSWYLDNQEVASNLMKPEIKHHSRRDLSVNKKRYASRVKCRNKLKMFICDVIFRNDVTEDLETSLPMKVECEFGKDLVLLRPTVVVTPPVTIARDGDVVTVLCKVETALKSCRIEKLVPNVGQSRHSWDLHDHLPASADGVVYTGRGLDKGECGFTLERVTQAFNGQFRCVMSFPQRIDEGVGVFNISVAGELGEEVVLPQPTVVVTPPLTVTREGDVVTVLCRAETMLKSCRIEKLAPSIGHFSRSWDLHENQPASEDGVVYSGRGLDKGECGFTVKRVTQAFNGQFRCVMSFLHRIDEGVGVFNISVAGKFGEEALARPTVVVTPPLTFVLEGGDVTVLCSTGSALKSCRIEKLAPSVGQSRPAWILQEHMPASQDGVIYSGRGLDKGDCGFTVERVTDAFNGQFRCVVSFPHILDESVGVFNISVAVTPCAPDLKVLPSEQQSTPPPGNGDFKGDFLFREGEILIASCAIRDSRPPATISWYLDDYKMTDGLSISEIIHVTDRDLFTVKQNISFPVSCKNNGKMVRCVAEHVALESNIHTAARINVACEKVMTVSPSVTLAREGDSVTVLCRAEGELKYCRIEKLAPSVGPSNSWWYLNENQPVSHDGVVYAGRGLAQGECGFTVQRVTAAFNGQFRCVAGILNQTDEGVGAFNISVLDCGDDSDETKDECGSFRCPSYAFQCDNKACINKDNLCNGIKECADGSDETIQRCGTNTTIRKPTTETTPSDACKLPPQPENGQYKLLGCKTPCQHFPGQIIDYAILIYSCKPGFVLSGASALVCEGGWSIAFPTCSPTCKALTFPSRVIQCKLNNQRVDCDQPMAPGTKATVQCNSFYTIIKELDDFVTTCQYNGKWSTSVYPCSPKCGEPNPKGIPFVAGGEDAKRGEFPWHAGIYRQLDKSYRQVCGGNIITERTIITVAHCFWDSSLQEQYDSRDYRVAVGKFYREWDHPEETRYQTPEIENVVLPSRFRGGARNWAEDIAVVRLKNMIVLRLGTAPICMDYKNIYGDVFVPGRNGIVMGWGYTEEQIQSDTLRKATMPYVAFDTCERKVPPSFLQFLTYDKFCAGYDNGTSVCGGDSGGGFAVKFKDGKYYLMGLVSVGVVSAHQVCDNFAYTTFTRVSEFYSFIKSNIS